MSIKLWNAETQTADNLIGSQIENNIIDDTTASTDKVYSSSKVESDYAKIITLKTIDEFKTFANAQTDIGMYMLNFPVGSQDLVLFLTNNATSVSSGGICTIKKNPYNNEIDVDIFLYNGAVTVASIRYHQSTENITVLRISHNEYSTDEKVIGTWIDGKPIYKMTTTSSDAISMPYVDTVVKLEHTGRYTASTMDFIYNNDTDANNFIRSEFDLINKAWTIRKGGGSTLVHRTIYYTKTTD